MNTRFLLRKAQLIVGIACLLFASCQSKEKDNKEDESIIEELASKELQLPEKPNILWLVTEDMGPYIAAFGDSTVETPNLSRLAAEGVVYNNMFSPAGVCAPSRAAIATGMYPSSIGANNMRTNSKMEETGLKPYEAVPAAEVKMLSEMLRENGYYCTNNYKTDYQFKAPVTAWDESSTYAHWRNRAKDQPFYAIFNFTDTHESGLFEPYGFRHTETRHYHAGDRSYKWGKDRMTEAETTVHIPKDTKFNIPPYLPNTEVVRRDMWKKYNNIVEMDKQVGAVLKQLEDDGLLENTIIFFYGDHGGPLPRQKRLIYDSGLKTSMIVRYPNKKQANTKDEQLLSFVDFTPTLLSIIGVKPPEYIQGQAFLGQYKAPERTYIHAATDRLDEITDAIRAVRDRQFKYIRNYRPEQAYYMPLAYREQIPAMQELLRLHKEGKLNSIQEQWFRQSKEPEELFDCIADPHELNNLAKDPAYAAKLKELSGEMDRWLTEINDTPNMPETELISKLWNGQDEQPTTTDPVITNKDGKITITCATEGASIGYKVDGKGKAWNIYKEPFTIAEDAKIQVIAHRIGYLASKTIDQKIADL